LPEKSRPKMNSRLPWILHHCAESRRYASKIRQGYRPAPRHWLALAELVGVTG
jgi:hypothetical protein